MKGDDLMVIRKVRDEDVKQLCEISKKTFIETFAMQNDEGDTNLYLNERMSEELLRGELNNGKSYFYFIEHRDQIVGYVKINTYLNYILLQRIYVLANYHYQGFGKELLNYVVEIARGSNKDYIELGVWEENKQAINFYANNGFYKTGEQDFILGTDVQTDYTMKLELKTKADL